MAYSKEIAQQRRKRGGQPGSQNAAKEEVKKMWSCRLLEEDIGKIISQARERNMSQAEYISWLVNAATNY